MVATASTAAIIRNGRYFCISARELCCDDNVFSFYDSFKDYVIYHIGCTCSSSFDGAVARPLWRASAVTHHASRDQSAWNAGGATTPSLMVGLLPRSIVQHLAHELAARVKQ